MSSLLISVFDPFFNDVFNEFNHSARLSANNSNNSKKNYNQRLNAAKCNLYKPPFDLIETDAAYQIDVDLPGLAKADINIAVKEHVLTISGVRNKELSTNVDNQATASSSQSQTPTDSFKFHANERPLGNFLRSFKLTEDAVNEGEISAKYEHGVLHVVLPKAAPKAKEEVKTISIE